MNVCSTDAFSQFVDAPAHYADPAAEEMQFAHPTALVDRNGTDGRAMVLTLSIGNKGMGNVDYGKFFPALLGEQKIFIFCFLDFGYA